MSPTALDTAASAAVITQAREGRTPRPLDFPAGLRPRDAAEAYAVQDAVVRARGPIAGWKVGAASPQAQPARAALTRDSVWVAAAGEPVLLAASGFAVMGVEAEWVYELGADLPARATPYSAAEVLAAVVPGLDLGSADRLVAARKGRALENLTDAAQIVGAVPQFSERDVDVKSAFFEVQGRLRLEARVLESRSLVERRSGRQLVVVWQQQQARLEGVGP